MGPQDGADRARGDRARAERGRARALGVSVAWMLAVQLGCVVLWDAGWFGRQGALVHWLLIGVLPPALALWTSGAQPPEDARG